MSHSKETGSEYIFLQDFINNKVSSSGDSDCLKTVYIDATSLLQNDHDQTKAEELIALANNALAEEGLRLELLVSLYSARSKTLVDQRSSETIQEKAHRRPENDIEACNIFSTVTRPISTRCDQKTCCVLEAVNDNFVI